MQIDAREFVKRKENNLAAKYMQRSMRQLVNRNATSTATQLSQVERAYIQFIEMPFRVKPKQA